MTREEYLKKLMQIQRNPMKDCSSGTLVVDHKHSTGEVRGLLCHNCNRALGLLKDDPKVLQKAMNYLVKCND